MVASIAGTDRLTPNAVAHALSPLRVVIARSLRTRLYLSPKSLEIIQGGTRGRGGEYGKGGSEEGGGERGQMLDVTWDSNAGSDVLYFVDIPRQRIILSEVSNSAGIPKKQIRLATDRLD